MSVLERGSLAVEVAFDHCVELERSNSFLRSRSLNWHQTVSVLSLVILSFY